MAMELNDVDIFIHAHALADLGVDVKVGNACVRRFISTFGTAELVKGFDEAFKNMENDEYNAEPNDDDLPPDWN